MGDGARALRDTGDAGRAVADAGVRREPQSGIPHASITRPAAVAVVLFAGCAAIWLIGLGFRGLFNPDEGRYAEIPREMLASGDWVIPHLNGLVYIEKPPLQYWATAHQRGGVRAECLGGAPLHGAVRAGDGGRRRGADPARVGRAWPRRAAPSCSGSSLLFVLLGHQLHAGHEPDAVHDADFRRLLQCAACRSAGARWMLLSWVGIAGAFMTKGLIAGVLPAVHARRLFAPAAGLGALAPACCWRAARCCSRCCACRG